MFLGIDTSIGTALALLSKGGEVLYEVQSSDTRAHAEVIGVFIEQALEVADSHTASTGENLRGVVIGMGPGPFTGLRIGIAAGRALAFGRGIPYFGVCSHDAMADLGKVGTDVRRREHAVSHYDTSGVRIFGPTLIQNTELAEDVHKLSEISAINLARLGGYLAENSEQNILTPFYLRDADAVPQLKKEGGA
ncbi:MAG: tRNA (adenosine(37)-N6)-threonylcarbamoyltransferase complex dimerization subunit type 1 TsaB [Microbacteriaceae bacterium]|nr:tRNA (adenosine(37)-N6)-threonylcarbamoyltransferase complex dimerization subunit type 1 TsaB [Microbacteriaceae bacterium]